MLRNMLAAALRHLARNRLNTTISVLGLTVGLGTALIAVLVIRNQYSYDHDVPGYERTFVVLAVFSPPGLAPQYERLTLLEAAGLLRLESAQIEATGRLLDERVGVERDGRRWSEDVYWADANLPDILPLPAYAGDVAAALEAADGVVLSRSYARRFFGRDAPLGETLMINGNPMIVRAVIVDPRPNATHEVRHIIAAGNAAFSTISVQERQPDDKWAGVATIVSGLTYVRLKPGTNVATLEQVARRLVQPPEGTPAMLSTALVRIDRLNAHEGLNAGFRKRMTMLGIIGAVVLLVAGVNFVNLQTARSMLRAREVAVRSAAGAPRGLVMAQFLGEALLHAGAAALLALALTEWLLPWINAFLDAGATLDYGREPWVIMVFLGAAALFGLLACAWPAFVQSRIRAVDALRGGSAMAAGGGGIRQGLVTLQFALLIALAISAGVVYLQREFALRESLRVDQDPVLMVGANSAAFAEELRRLPGVRAVTRADIPLLGEAGFGGMRGISIGASTGRDGKSLSFHTIGVDFDLFDFYGIKPLAGRLPAADGQAPRAASSYAVINETALRRFELGTPAQALEKELPIGTPDAPGTPEQPASTRVLAVVPDFSLDSVAVAVPPTVYVQPPGEFHLVNVRLSGREIPETLAAIDALWAKTGNTGSAAVPFRFFLDEHFQRHYQGVLRQSQAFGIGALIAILLSGVGLFALTAAAAERRTREIGIRKALGADTSDVLRLLLWQFARPVVWANLLAWPVAGYLMQRWLAGFAYHIDLPLWLFPSTGLVAVLIAMATVSVQALAVARTKPVVALRHE